MTDTEARLVRCFSVVFPEVGFEEIPHASTSSVARWDSIATITLMTVIEEEFGVMLGLENLEQMNSFAAVLAYLREKPAVP